MTNHVPTLETCQKLKEAGFPQETIYHWCRISGTSEWDVLSVTVGALIKMKADYADYCAAPILSEILEQLPREIPAGMLRYQQPMAMAYLSDGFSIGYSDMTGKYSRFTKNKNPAEAAALLWLELNGGNNAKPE